MENIYKDDPGIQVLLDLNGVQYYFEDGFWVKIEAMQVAPSKHMPHGLSYSLTLHDSNNTRLLGFDNAHGIKNPRKKKFSSRVITWDHKHKLTTASHYEFESASQLIEDFWNEVDKIRSE